MSDPVTNLEIEDVLSSIRRLVSEDARPRSKPVTRPYERPERLVLTPAQRVAEERDEIAAARDKEDAADEIFFKAEAPAVKEVDSSSVYESAEPQVPPSPEPSYIGRLVSEEVERMLAAQTDSAPPQAQQAAATSESEMPEMAAPAGQGTAHAERGDSLADKISLIEALVARQKADRTPEAAPSVAFVHRDVESLEWVDHPREQKPVSVDRLPVSNVEPEVRSDEQPKVRSNVEPEVRNDDQPEVRNDDRPELCDQDQPEVHKVDAPVAGNASPRAEGTDGPLWLGQGVSPRDSVEDTVPVNAQAEAADPAALIDQEVLRDMVGDVVRQELQGALGERITRNVRKLVRREIHRMLASKDLH